MGKALATRAARPAPSAHARTRLRRLLQLRKPPPPTPDLRSGRDPPTRLRRVGGPGKVLPCPANPALPRVVSECAGIPALRQGWSGHNTKNALARSLGASRRSPSSYHETPPASRACAEVCAAQLANKDQKTGGGRHLCHQQEGAESPRAGPRLPWPCIPHLTARSAAGRRWAERLDGVSVKMSSRDPIRRLLHTCSVLSAPGPGETGMRCAAPCPSDSDTQDLARKTEGH